MEPEDAKTESDFQLRRIGPPGSCPNVLDVMRIKIGVTSFGRGDGCNFYLDSKNLKNFISRKHAEIHTVKNEDGELDFVLHHKGLNGTFVNDIKAPPQQLLAEGDKITFGHKNGYNLKPGQYASQPNSEFQYVFEKVKLAKKEVSRSPKKEVVNVDKVDTKLSSHNDLTDNNSVSKDQKSPSKQKTKNKSSPKKLEIEKTVQKSSPVEKVQNRKYLGTNNSAVSRKHASTSSSSSSSIVVPSSDDEDEDEEISPSHRGNKENDSFKFSLDKKEKSSVNRGETFNYGNSLDKSANKSAKLNSSNSSNKQETPSSTNKNVKINGTKRKLLPSNNNSKKSKRKDDSPSSSSSDSESSEDDDDNDKSDKSDKSDDDDDDDDDNDDDGDDDDSEEEKKLTIPDPFDLKSEKRTNGKKISEMNKKTRSSLIGPPKRPLNIKSNKRKAPQKVTNTNNKKGAKRQKRVTKSQKDDSDYEDEEDLEDGVEWYEEEMCAASDCRKPKNKRVGWVQCDDCDNWYHTECVGCRYEHVKDTNIKFSCGCR